MTILVRNGEPCIDHKATGANAAKWRRAVNVSQETLAVKGMGISQSLYGALELGKRSWTPEYITKFERAILPLIKEQKINVDQL